MNDDFKEELKDCYAEIERLSEANTQVWADNERLRAEVQTWQGHARTAIWSDSEECKLLTADNERLRAALLKIKRGSVWNCDIEAFIDAALAQEKQDD